MKTAQDTFMLQVTEAQAKDVGRAIARIDPKDMAKLQVEIGEVAELAGDILTLSAEEKGRKYNKEVLLPSPVKAETLRKSFKNGILEIRLEKK